MSVSELMIVSISELVKVSFNELSVSELVK